MKNNHQHTLLAAALVSALAAATTAQAADATAATTPATTAPAASNDDAWKFGVTVPLWAPEINGNVTTLGRVTDVNVNFSELKSHLDSSVSLSLNAQKDKFGLFGNVGYMKFTGGGGDPLGGHTDWMLRFAVANAGLSYQLIRTETEHPFILTGTAGTRFWYTSTDIYHRDSTNTRDFHKYNNLNLFDAVIGLRATQYITQKLHVDVAGDYGGFNCSHDVDTTWSASGMLTYDFTMWFSLSGGYQALGLKESDGTGASKNGVNITFSGIAAALAFKF